MLQQMRKITIKLYTKREKTHEHRIALKIKKDIGDKQLYKKRCGRGTLSDFFCDFQLCLPFLQYFYNIH